MTQPIPTIKAIVFDFDGTIADSFPVFVHAVEYALKRKSFTPDEIENLRQYSMREVIKILKVRRWKLPFVAAKGMREIDRHQDDIVIFPNIAKYIKTLHGQGYKLYIVSSHSKQGIQVFLEQYGIENEFDYIYSKVGLFGKPKALKKLQVQFGYLTTECIFVGDEVRDIEAAKKANMQCIAVSWGFNTTTALQEHNPSAIVDKPSKLPEALKSLS